MRLTITIMTLLITGLIISEPPAATAIDATELMVLYSNNVNGEIEPCG